MSNKIMSDLTGGNFIERYNKIEKSIPFNKDWNNGTGYYDGAVHDVKLEPGEEAKSISPMPNNRRIIFIGTQLGTIVLFERYTNGADGVIVKNISGAMRRLSIIPDGQVGYDALSNILSYGPEDNIGARLARVFDLKKDSEDQG